jgi:anti-sigma regulatory factor (Ser/Thr protein kinase)
MALVTAAMADAAAQCSIQIPGGGGAPGLARRHVLSRLEGRIPSPIASDAALIASELVTNSVLHADVDHERELTLELATLGDRIRLAVTDAGSDYEPRMLADNRTTPGGFGLRLVNDLSSAWGVERDASGRTRVWCELVLMPASG